MKYITAWTFHRSRHAAFVTQIIRCRLLMLPSNVQLVWVRTFGSLQREHKLVLLVHSSCFQNLCLCLRFLKTSSLPIQIVCYNFSKAYHELSAVFLCQPRKILKESVVCKYLEAARPTRLSNKLKIRVILPQVVTTSQNWMLRGNLQDAGITIRSQVLLPFFQILLPKELHLMT